MEASPHNQLRTRASQPRLALGPHPSPSLSSTSSAASSSSSASRSSQRPRQAHPGTQTSSSQRAARKEPRQTQLQFPKSFTPKTPVSTKSGRVVTSRDDPKAQGWTATPTQLQPQSRHTPIHRNTPKDGRDVADASTRALSPAPSASPLTVSMLGKAPSSTLRTNMRPGQTPTRVVEVESDTDEEEMWIQRAQALSGRKKARVSSPVVDPLPQQPAAPRPPSAQVTAVPPSPASPVTSPGKKQDAAPITPLRPLRPGAPGSASVEGSSPQTPHMHCPMEEFSMLPWEHAAALKAIQYRTSAGLKPTERDLQAKMKAEMEMAEKARRAAIARGVGRTTSPIKRPGPSTPTPQPPAKRQALAPRNIPNSPNPDITVAPSARQPPVHAAAGPSSFDAENAVHEEAEVVKPTQALLTPGHNLRRRQVRGSGVGTPPPSTPIAPLNAIVSPRTNRKVYALETQGPAPLPHIFDRRPAAARRRRNGHEEGEDISGSGGDADRPLPVRMPSDPDARQRILDMFGDSPLTSEQDPEGSEEERSSKRSTSHRQGSSGSASGRSSLGEQGVHSAVAGRSGHSETAPGGTLSPAPPSSSPDEIPATPFDSYHGNAALDVEKARKARKTAPTLGHSLATSRKFRPLAAERGRSDDDNDDVEGETQPLGGAFDDSLDDTVLMEREGAVAGRNDEANAESDDETQPLPGDEETQPLPFADGDEDDLEQTPPAPPSSAKPTGWAGVNAAWEGVDLRTGPAPSPVTGSPADVSASGGKRKGRRSQGDQVADAAQSQCTLTQYGFPSTLEPHNRNRVETPTQTKSRAKPQMILPHRSDRRKDSHPGARAYFAEHPLSRDATDVLSDDEGFEWDPSGEDERGDRTVNTDADDSGLVDASAGALQKSKGKGRTTSSRRDKPPPAPSSDHSADVSEEDSQETQPLPWDDEDSEKNVHGVHGGVAEQGKTAKPMPRGRPTQSSSTCSASDTQDEEDDDDELPLAVGARMTPWPSAYGARRAPNGKGTATRTGPTSSPSSDGSGDGNGWVPSMDVDMGSEVEGFFGRLSDD